MNEHTIRYKCESCGHYENCEYRFGDCCKSCGHRVERHGGCLNHGYESEVGYWQYREKGYKNIICWLFNMPILEKIWVKKEEI